MARRSGYGEARVDLLVLGSCRVVRPLRHLLSAERVRIVNYGAYWFTHSAKDALQYLDVLEGRSIPDELFDLIVGTGSLTAGKACGRYDPRNGPHAASVVEVSTYKLLRYRGWFLHLDQFRIKCREIGVHPDLLAEKLKTPMDRRGDDHFAALPMPPRYGALFAETELVAQSDQELEADLTELRRRIGGPIVFVDHFNIPREDGVPFPERERLTRSLRRHTAQLGVRFYETAPAILAAGPAQALVDINHYTAEFEPIVAGRLLATVSEAVEFGHALVA